MPLTISEKGKKRFCENCNSKWYDLNKKPIVCPVCKQEFQVNDLDYYNLLNSQIEKKSKNVSETKLDDYETKEDALENNDEADLVSLEEVEEETS